MHYTRTIDSVAYSTMLEEGTGESQRCIVNARAESAVLGKHIGERLLGHDVYSEYIIPIS